MKKAAVFAIAFLFFGAAMLIAKPDREAREVYLAVTVYLDSMERLREGPHGDISEVANARR